MKASPAPRAATAAGRCVAFGRHGHDARAETAATCAEHHAARCPLLRQMFPLHRPRCRRSGLAGTRQNPPPAQRPVSSRAAAADMPKVPVANRSGSVASAAPPHFRQAGLPKGLLLAQARAEWADCCPSPPPTAEPARAADWHFRVRWAAADDFPAGWRSTLRPRDNQNDSGCGKTSNWCKKSPAFNAASAAWPDNHRKPIAYNFSLTNCLCRGQVPTAPASHPYIRWETALRPAIARSKCPERLGAATKWQYWRDALRSRRLAWGARPRRSVALQVGAQRAATTERGPPGRRAPRGHDGAWPSKARCNARALRAYRTHHADISRRK